MKKLNPTYVLGILGLAIALWIGSETLQLTDKLVSNEPGPKLFPMVSAIGIAVCSVLTMIFDGPKDYGKSKDDKNSYLRMALILAECAVIAVVLKWVGFWIGSMLGLFALIMTLKNEKKINYIFTVCLCIGLSSLVYFGFTKGFAIPLPSGELWDLLGIPMP